MKPILVKGRPLARGRSAVCVPLVGRSHGALLDEAAAAAALEPDLVEWRVDFFEGIGRQSQVLATAAALRGVLGPLPVLFTRRSVNEGGQPIGIDGPAVVALYEAVCAAGAADLVDVEMATAPAHLRAVQRAAQRHGVALVLSFHDFQATPPLEVLNQRFLQAQSLGADVAKVAVMPRSMEDVLTLLTATLKSSEQLSIPLVSMAMGPQGTVSRLCGGAFGSALSFGAGAAASAPGQLPVAGLKAALALLQSAGAPPAGA
jgi:3-dehydroquinate dehydratase-1